MERASRVPCAVVDFGFFAALGCLVAHLLRSIVAVVGPVETADVGRRSFGVSRLLLVFVCDSRSPSNRMGERRTKRNKTALRASYRGVFLIPDRTAVSPDTPQYLYYICNYPSAV